MKNLRDVTVCFLVRHLDEEYMNILGVGTAKRMESYADHWNAAHNMMYSITERGEKYFALNFDCNLMEEPYYASPIPVDDAYEPVHIGGGLAIYDFAHCIYGKHRVAIYDDGSTDVVCMDGPWVGKINKEYYSAIARYLAKRDGIL